MYWKTAYKMVILHAAVLQVSHVIQKTSTHVFLNLKFDLLDVSPAISLQLAKETLWALP